MARTHTPRTYKPSRFDIFMANTYPGMSPSLYRARRKAQWAAHPLAIFHLSALVLLACGSLFGFYI